MLLFSVMISFNSYGEWSLVVTSTDKAEYYIDFDRVSNKNGYVYYWNLVNYPNVREDSQASSTRLYQVDCNPPYKERRLAYYFYYSAMGNGPVSTEQILTLDWVYAPPGSVREIMLEEIC